MFYWLCWVLAFLPIRILWPTKVIGKKNIPKKQKVILSCNHTSNLDVVIINSRLVPNPYILAKHTLFKNKFFGAILRSWRAIPVNRDNVELSTIKKVFSVLKKDKMLLVFPQGKREKEVNDIESTKNGLVMFALKSGAPIVPMWYLKKPRLFRRNVLLIGKPFYLEELQGQKIDNQVLQRGGEILVEKMQALRDDYLQQLELKKQAKIDKKQSKTKI